MIYKGGCHCGHIAFEAEGDLRGVMDCNCSICSKRGALWWFLPRAQIKFTTPEANLSTYQFGKRRISHHFCAICGCAPLGAMLHEGVEKAAINVRCLEDVDLSKLSVKHFDGRSL